MSNEELSPFDAENDVAAIPVEDDRGDIVVEEVEDIPAVDEPKSEEELIVEEALEPEPEPEPEPATIPKARLDAELAKRRAVEAKLAEYEQSQPTGVQSEFDFDTKEELYADAILDGDKEQARTLRAEIRHAEKQQYQSDVAYQSNNTLNQAKEQRDFDAATARLVASNNVFDEASPGFNGDLVDRTNVMFAGYVNQGYTRSDAIQMAAETMLQTVAPVALGGATPKTVQSRVAEKVAASAKQPPTAGGMNGASAGKSNIPDVMSMDDAQFSAFVDKEPDTYHDLRGDFVPG